MSLGWLERALDLSEEDAILAARALDWATGDTSALGLPAPETVDETRANRAALLGPLVAARWGRREADDDLRTLWRLTCELAVAAGVVPVEREPLVELAARLLCGQAAAR